ncbi:MAG TPA: hypothetical protein VH307_09405 [Streptosporangiaceae bacterium]|nr:hypothetical protein [Streptosporangiaceae bacterium]
MLSTRIARGKGRQAQHEAATMVVQLGARPPARHLAAVGDAIARALNATGTTVTSADLVLARR